MHQQKLIHVLGNYTDVSSKKSWSVSIDKFLSNLSDNALKLAEFKNMLDPNGITKMVHKFVAFSTK